MPDTGQLMRSIPIKGLRFIKREDMSELVEFIVGEDSNNKGEKRIIKKNEAKGFNQIVSTDKKCPKCQKRNLDNLGLFRVIGGIIEMFRCEKCRHVECETKISFPEENKK